MYRRLSWFVICLALASVACRSVGPETPVVRPAGEAAEAVSTTEASSSAAAASQSEAVGSRVSATGDPVTSAATRQVVVLHINDVYRIAGVDEGQAGGLARVRALRSTLEQDGQDVLFLHAGDLLFPSLLSRLYSGAQMIDVLNLMDGDAAAFDDQMFAVFGNHEFDKDDDEDAAMVDRRVEESAFYWLDTNIEFRPESEGLPGVEAWNMVKSRIVTSNGVRVGIFGLTTDMEHPAYVTRFLDPVEVARRQVKDLRTRGAEVIIALTHLDLPEDRRVLEALGEGGPDLVLGGHEHNEIEEQVADRWILKANAEARSATVVRIDVPSGQAPVVRYSFADLDAEAPLDQATAAAAAAWLKRHDREYCVEELELSPGCLDYVFGHTNVRLSGEELDLRRFETNWGNWVADRALEAFADQGAQVAFINSGSLRLNQDIPAGTDITRRHVEETFQYPSGLSLLRITGAALQEATENAVKGWTGQGKWMQVSGFAFRHHPDSESVDGLTLLGPDGPRPVDPDEELLLVTTNYVATPSTGQDGYTMLTADMGIPVETPPVLRDLVVDALKTTRSVGISPEVEGRICNAQRPGPCLAVLP